jgi:ribose transport system substrate-binding protein
MLELLRAGSIKAIIAQNPYTMGYLGVAEAVAAILGKDTGPDYINTGVGVIRNNEGRGAKWDREK